MDPLKTTYDKIDQIPEAFRPLFTEKDGKHLLTGVVGLKTQADLDRLQASLEKERTEHKGTKEKFTPFAELLDRDPKDILAKLDKYAELEAAAAGKLPEEKIKELAEARVKSILAPLERDKAKLAKDLETANKLVEEFRGKETRRAIHDEVRKAAVLSKVIDSAQEDVLMLAERIFEVTDKGVFTKDNVGVTPGLSADVWLTEMQEKRPHWWPASQGGGAGGSRGNGSPSSNPWSAEGWNVTEQGNYLKAHGAEKAGQLAKMAGTSVGGRRPVLAKK